MKKNILFLGIFALIIFAILPHITFPSVSAAYHSYAVIDAKTGRILMGENEHERMPIASLTKIWTALVAIENNNLQDKVVISGIAATAEGSSIYLKSGDELSVETLLYGLMLRSGNDAAHALAEHTAESVDGFVDMMNEKAVLSGLDQTTFTNPSGLHHENHLSSAYDTAQMLRIAMENESFRKIASTKLFRFNDDGPNAWQNKHRLVRQDEHAIAGKTGYTKVAGRTLATYFEDGDKAVIVVTLNASDDWNLHQELANEVFSNYKIETVAKAGKYEIAPKVIGVLDKPIQLLMKKEEKDKLKNVMKMYREPSRKNEGMWNIYIDDELVMSKLITIEHKK